VPPHDRYSMAQDPCGVAQRCTDLGAEASAGEHPSSRILGVGRTRAPSPGIAARHGGAVLSLLQLSPRSRCGGRQSRQRLSAAPNHSIQKKSSRISARVQIKRVFAPPRHPPPQRMSPHARRRYAFFKCHRLHAQQACIDHPKGLAEGGAGCARAPCRPHCGRAGVKAPGPAHRAIGFGRLSFAKRSARRCRPAGEPMVA
jgi:hypothetical protein